MRLTPYLVCAIRVCSVCEGDFLDPASWKETYRCCGQRRRSYFFESGLRTFLLDTFSPRKGMKRGIAIAFNLRLMLYMIKIIV